MRATKSIECDLPLANKLSLTTEELMQMLSCGRRTAVEIGTQAKSRVQVGRRVLWNVSKVQAYLDGIAE
jgi:hypothetical protein